MNKEQRALYEYLVTLPDSVFDNWLQTASTEELAHADEIFQIARYGDLDKTEDLSEARALLQRFTLGGK